MRYYLYKDSEVQGPFAPEELDVVGGISSDCLVCAEDASGRYDSDWRLPTEVQELATANLASSAATAILEGPEGELPELSGAALEMEEWFAKLFEMPPPKASEETDALAGARRQIGELTGQVEALRSRLLELENLQKSKPESQPLPVAAERSGFLAHGAKFTVAEAAEINEEPSSVPLHFSTGRAFRVVTNEPPNPAESEALEVAVPEPGPVPEAHTEPPALEIAVVAPPAAIEPPITMRIAAPESGPTAPALNIPEIPMPSLEPAAPPASSAASVLAPASGGFLGGVLPEAALTPSRANAGVVTPPEADSEDVLARLAKPAEESTTVEKPKGRRFLRGMLIGILGLAALMVLILLFLRNSGSLKSMVNMGADQKPIGAVSDEELKAAPAPQPSSVELPNKAQPPAAGRDMIPDSGQAAIALVKSYPLAGERSSVGQWLSYSFTANPADGNKELWTAGAIDATTYAVEYRLQPGPHSAIKESIAYIFEADITRKTVRGSNQAARQLLAGGEPAKPSGPVKVAKPSRRRFSAKRTRRTKTQPKGVPLLALPADSELLPPAEEGPSSKLP